MNKNIIWEDKGIILGLIKYIMKYNELLLHTDIIIENKQIRHILISLFNHHSFKKKYINDKKNSFYISIKSNQYNKLPDDLPKLIINNLKNIDVLHTKKITLLPWYDEDNPIVMFEYNKNNIKTFDNAFNKIYKFKKYRLKSWSKYTTYIDNLYNMQTWDTYIEYQIIKNYCTLYNQNFVNIHNFIYSVLKNPYFTNIKFKPIYVPVINQIYAKNDNNKELLKMIVKKINNVNDLLNINKK